MSLLTKKEYSCLPEILQDNLSLGNHRRREAQSILPYVASLFIAYQAGKDLNQIAHTLEDTAVQKEWMENYTLRHSMQRFLTQYIKDRQEGNDYHFFSSIFRKNHDFSKERKIQAATWLKEALQAPYDQRIIARYTEFEQTLSEGRLSKLFKKSGLKIPEFETNLSNQIQSFRIC